MSSDAGSLRSEVPPLRVHHLLAWMAVTAAFLAGQRMTSEYIAHSLPGNGPVELSLLPAIAWAISCGIAAAAFTLAVFTIWWWFQGFEALGQPGQWLPLPAILTPLVWSLSYFTFIAGVVKSNASLEWTWYYGKIPVAIASFVLELGMHVLPAVTFVCCAILIADTRAWRFYLSALAARHAVRVAALVFNSLGLLPPYTVVSYSAPYLPRALSALWIGWTTIELLALAVALATDVAGRRPRYWTHWAGAGIDLAGRLSAAVFGFANWVP
jgi:hypothetical protein